MTTEPCSRAVLLGRLRECDRILPRPGTIRSPSIPTVPWDDFCDPAGPWLACCVAEWQERGGFRHHRAGVVLVAFRFGWLACCATVPEYHLGVPLPSLAGLRVAVTAEGRLSGLRPTGDQLGESSPQQWWAQLCRAFEPLTRALHALGGPAPESQEYWGNPVGSLGTVLWRLQRCGLPGDAMATARELRAATGREHLLDIDPERDPWTRRTTCCQWWRNPGSGYCEECVLWNSRSRSV
ncbi:(2Fe-2S)-binding protein [Saccharopolyspora sp. NPDC000995]